ncbi:MAG: CoA transferase [Chloroflexi bacterium]|nr:CoA transferase [Chloroflexota bacterium]
MQPLHGIRVLDFSRVLAGPFCTMLLADLGADVIKVEDPAGGDETRRWGPPWAALPDGSRLSTYYLSVNRNKRSLTLNLKTAAGRDLARRLAAESHIVVENLKPGGMESFGLGYNDLAALHPALVYTSISGYGQTGPYHTRPGYDFVIQAMSGLMSITGPETGPPAKVGVAIADVIAGLFAATSALAALRHAEATGQGQHIDVALFDTAIAALVNVVSGALISGAPPQRYGSAHPSIVPYQPFAAADGLFALAVGNDRQFAALCDLIARPDLAADPRYATNPARVTHRDSLIPTLAAIFARRTAADWVADLLARGVPAGPLNTIPAMLADPQVAARGLIHEVEIAETVLRMIGPPVGFSATPPEIRTPPPTLGADTATILRERLDLDAAAIAQLRADGVL